MRRAMRVVVAGLVCLAAIGAAPALADSPRHGYPWVTFTPAAAPIGTLVHFQGTLPPTISRSSVANGNWWVLGTVIVPGGGYCGIVPDLTDERIAIHGHDVSGSFRLGDTGGC